MNCSQPLYCGLISLISVTLARAGVHVSWERSNSPRQEQSFSFKAIGRPQSNDIAKSGTFKIISGSSDLNGGGLEALNDGRLPRAEDMPRMNFFFAAGTKGGRLLLDLGKTAPVAEVRSFSCHPADRGPQVYKLYARDQAEADPGESQAGDLESLGWRHLASVDTRGKDEVGGQYAVSIRETGGTIGRFRYLLFDISPTESRDPFGNTFFSEIDVIESGAAEEKDSSSGEKSITQVIEDGHFKYTFDTTVAPDLTEWTTADLAPVVKEWYPRLVEMLPGEGYGAPTNILLRFRDDMGGTPASAGGARINCNADWFRRNLKGEAIGAVVHEMAHVVQNYGWGRRNNPNANRTPGWIVEGIPDYIRWFLYEPQTKGAEITRRNLERARYDANYRISGNFLDWVARRHGQEVIWKINAAAREGKYNDELWKQLTGSEIKELGDAWRTEHEQRLNSP